MHFTGLVIIGLCALQFTTGSEELYLEAIPLEDVRLKLDSRFDKAVSLNKEYLLGIDSDRLLKTFRSTSWYISASMRHACLTSSLEAPN